MPATPSKSLTVLAPAKLNLALSVGPPNGDGMHPICSWMVTVSLFDELLLTRLEDDRFSRYAILWHPEAKRRSDIDWPITKDLAVRAHLALESHLDRKLPVQLKLDKRIPVGGGLGGGSSNAAAMLRGLNTLFDLGLAADELAAIGATLGSDVPFLVHGGSAVVEGLGDRISRQLRMPPLHSVIA
jgi:4-diphosphocytidyl-2-C-methyl-D-erythritol kinase